MWQIPTTASSSRPQQQLQPLCLSDPGYKSAIEQVSEQISVENKTASLKAFIIGSGHRKLTPPDVDILVLSRENISITLQYIEQNMSFFNNTPNMQENEYTAFYEQLPVNSITRVLAALCRSRKANIEAVYTKKNRSLMTLRFDENIHMDLNLQNAALIKHADKSDFSINTLYFDIKTGKYAYLHKSAMEDIRTKTLRSARNDASLLFRNDITILFRAIRIISTEGYAAEPGLLKAMQELPEKLPGAINTMNPDRLTLDKTTLFCSGYAIKSLSFLEENRLFDYIFPEDNEENHQTKEEKLFLFRRIAEASDALYHDDINNAAYPHALVKFFESQIEIQFSKEEKQKLTLCLFDYTIHYNELLNENFAPNKYSIFKHQYSLGFHGFSRQHIMILEEVGREIISRHLNAYHAIENDNKSTGETTVEEEPSDSESNRSSDEPERKDSIDNSSHDEGTSEFSDSDENPTAEKPLAPTPSIQQPNENTSNHQTDEEGNEAEPKKNKKKKKSHGQRKKTQALTPEETRISNMYGDGLGHFLRQEYEQALYLLKPAAEYDICQEVLRGEITELLSTAEIKDTVTYPKKSLSIAILCDVVGEHDDAIKYYQKFLLEKMAVNFFPDENEQEESATKYSFVYLRLMILFKELPKNTEKHKNFAAISAKFMNEIIISPIISGIVKSQAAEYMSTQSLQSSDSCSNELNPEESLNEANKDFDRGLYFTARINYYSALKYVKDSGATIFLIRRILICYIQLEMYEQSICFFGKIRPDLKSTFIKQDNNAHIMEKILTSFSSSICKDPSEDKERELFIYFQVATIYSTILSITYAEDKKRTEKVDNLFSTMTTYWKAYTVGMEIKGYKKIGAITDEERDQVSRKISMITFALTEKKVSGNPASFYSASEPNAHTDTTALNTQESYRASNP